MTSKTSTPQYRNYAQICKAHPNPNDPKHKRAVEELHARYSHLVKTRDEDAYQVGQLALMRAIRRIDPTFDDTQAENFVRFKIIGAIQDLKRDKWAAEYSRWAAEADRLRDETGREIDITLAADQELISLRTGYNPKALQRALRAIQTDVELDTESTPTRTTIDTDTTTESIATDWVLEHASPRDRHIIGMVADGYSYREIAEHLGISKVAVCHAVKTIQKNAERANEAFKHDLSARPKIQSRRRLAAIA